MDKFCCQHIWQDSCVRVTCCVTFCFCTIILAILIIVFPDNFHCSYLITVLWGLLNAQIYYATFTSLYVTSILFWIKGHIEWLSWVIVRLFFFFKIQTRWCAVSCVLLNSKLLNTFLTYCITLLVVCGLTLLHTVDGIAVPATTLIC